MASLLKKLLFHPISAILVLEIGQVYDALYAATYDTSFILNFYGNKKNK